jgi:putative ABC transport system substrate-binding protein
MRRRDVLSLLGGAAATWPLAARAQQVSNLLRIGYLSPGSASSGPLNYYDEFRRELRELGYVDGRNIVIDYRFADGKFDRLPQLAAELVQLNVDVIVSVVTQASLAAKNATRTIPIVYRQRWRSCGGRARRKSCATGRQCDGKLLDDH